MISGVGTWEVCKKGWKHREWRPPRAEWNLDKTGQILVKPWSNLTVKPVKHVIVMVTKHSQTKILGVGTWEVCKKEWKHCGWRPPRAEWNLIKTCQISGQTLVKCISQTSQTYYFMVTKHSQTLISGAGTWEVGKKGWKHRGWRPPRAEWNLVKTGQIMVKPWSYLTVKPVKHIILWLLKHSQTLDFRGWRLGSVRKGVKAPWVTPIERRVESGQNRPNSGQTLVKSK